MGGFLDWVGLVCVDYVGFGDFVGVVVCLVDGLVICGGLWFV